MARVTLALLCPSRNAISSTLSPASSARLATVWRKAVPQRQGSPWDWDGLILAVVGVLGIGLVDNVLRPIIIQGRLRMPLLAIFFSVLGGIELFGLIGLVMGPLVLAVFISVVDIMRDVETDYGG